MAFFPATALSAVVAGFGLFGAAARLAAAAAARLAASTGGVTRAGRTAGGVVLFVFIVVGLGKRGSVR